jgi:hypothetical protein
MKQGKGKPKDRSIKLSNLGVLVKASEHVQWSISTVMGKSMKNSVFYKPITQVVPDGTSYYICRPCFTYQNKVAKYVTPQKMAEHSRNNHGINGGNKKPCE